MVHRTPFFLPWLYPALTWRIPDASKQLFLTFDDGPVPGPTEFVLETLAAADIKATFFCIGDNISKHTSLYKALVKGGHTLGNHTFHHLNGWRTPTDRYVDNISQCAAVMDCQHPSNGRGRQLFRPPYGRITRRQIDALTSFRIIMWDVLTMDYNKRLPGEQCLRNTIAAVRDGSIIVFHDSLKAEKNLAYALPRCIDHFISKGFTFNVIPSC